MRLKKFLTDAGWVGVIVTVIFGIIATYFAIYPRGPSDTPIPYTNNRTPIPTNDENIQISHNIQQITLETGQTGKVFGGDLVITANFVNALQGFVTVTVGTAGYSNVTIDEARLGSAFLYEGEHKYDIRIMKITPGSAFGGRSAADFEVTQLQK